ncbi:MAG: hypothetical protein WCY62_09310 [Clostridia bacterium]
MKKLQKKLFIPPDKVNEYIKARETVERKPSKKMKNQESDELCLLTEQVIRGAYKIERGGK